MVYHYKSVKSVKSVYYQISVLSNHQQKYNLLKNSISKQTAYFCVSHKDNVMKRPCRRSQPFGDRIFDTQGYDYVSWKLEVFAE